MNVTLKLPCASKAMRFEMSRLTRRSQLDIPRTARGRGRVMSPQLVLEAPKASCPNCDFGKKPFTSNVKFLPNFGGVPQIVGIASRW